MSSDRNATATFAPNSKLTVTGTGTGTGTGLGAVTSEDGSISCPCTCSGDYPRGTIVTLAATPHSGSTFTGWPGGGCSGTGTCAMTMSSDGSVTATFALNPMPIAKPSAKPSCALTPKSARVKIASQRVLKLIARCDQAVNLNLAAKIGSVPKAKKGKRRTARTFEVGAPSAQAAAGVPLTLTAKLPAAPLKSGAHDSVTFALTAVTANGTSTTTAKVAHLILV